MHTIKRSLLLIIATMLIVMMSQGVVYAADTTISSNACSIRYWDSPTYIPESLRYIWNIESKFYANRLTVSYPALKTIAGKNIKQSYLRLFETRNGIEAGKSAEKYSAVAPSKTHATQIYTFLSMMDSPDWDLKTNVSWIWFYF